MNIDYIGQYFHFDSLECDTVLHTVNSTKLLAKGRNPLHQFPRCFAVAVRNKLATWQLPRVRESCGKTGLMDFGLKEAVVARILNGFFHIH